MMRFFVFGGGGSSRVFLKDISWSSWRPGKSRKEGQQDQGVQR